MIVEAGHFALVLALALALVNAAVPLYGHYARDARLLAVAPSVAVAGFGFTAMAFLALTYAHVASDFSLVNVVENSASTKPLIYKITGVWGNHEGSMLLWVLILAVFAAALACGSRGMPADLRALVLCVQSWIAAAFLLFILLTSDPFARIAQAPLEGQDLNPLLQDPGLAIHPPLLYLGYVGFSMTFSFAAAALIAGRIDAAWARFVRPWTLVAWIFLTLGIAMGSYWAYYTLGWGGFWFWDPVENASLMPWLAGTALLHSAVVMEKREALKIWTIFLAILTFSLSLVGTFLVRSGVLTSVHAFATDPTRGVFILLILVVFIGGSLALFAWRAGELKPGGIFAPVSREGALVLNNLLLTTCCATVFTGTLYPLALEAATGQKISVGAPFFPSHFRAVDDPTVPADAVRAIPRVEARRPSGSGPAPRRGARRWLRRPSRLRRLARRTGHVLRACRIGALRRCGVPRRSRATPVRRRPRRRVVPLRRPAALGLWHGARPRRCRRDPARPRRRGLGTGEHPVHEARRYGRSGSLHGRAAGPRAGRWTELRRHRGA